tara:strand:+ start:955 stop:2043 length:1089 start_codon:yes stop_codon:yes gene_type:complete
MTQLKNSGNPPNTIRGAMKTRASRLKEPTQTLVALTDVANGLGLKPKKDFFDTHTFIPLTYIPAKELYVDGEFQRFVIKSFIKSTKKFEGALARPLLVFRRPKTKEFPNGRCSVGDGQHTVILAILLTTQGSDLSVPCQVIEHPSDYDTQQCIDDESHFFEKLNRNRSNVSTIDLLRANIARKDVASLDTQDILIDMGVHVEMIGDPEGPEVRGYKKLMDAHDSYGLASIRRSIQLYQRLQENKQFPKWNEVDKPLNGGIIGGLAATYYLMEGQFLGEASKKHALGTYLENYLGNIPLKGKGSINENTAGAVQSTLIARRIVNGCNGLILNKIITKKNGDVLHNVIGEDVMSNAGLGDPSKN